ncbi:MAG: hypothetical protein WCQ41_01155 [Bacillota bacterium]
MFLGLVFIFVAYAIGLVIWILASTPDTGFIESLNSLQEEVKNIADITVYLHIIPAVVIYVLWYIALAGRDSKKKLEGSYLYSFMIPLILIVTFASLFVPAMLFAFSDGIALLILNTFLITIASTVALLKCRPY